MRWWMPGSPMPQSVIPMPSNATLAFLGFLAFLGLLRIWELVRSKQNAKAHQDAVVVKERLFTWMVLLHASFFVILPLELWLRKPEIGGPITYAAMMAVALALALRVWTLRTLGKSWNVRVVEGPNYPIISEGPYRHIRHPNYVVVVIELACVPLIHGLYFSALFLTIANALVLRVRVVNEENALARNPEWVTRMAHKPRFVPRLGRSD